MSNISAQAAAMLLYPSPCVRIGQYDADLQHVWRVVASAIAIINTLPLPTRQLVRRVTENTLPQPESSSVRPKTSCQ